jgi:hypothetical protein
MIFYAPSISSFFLVLIDNKFLEFEAWALNYPLRERLECSFDMRSLNISWDQGASINLAVCGYTTRQTVLLQLRHVAYLEVYKLMPPDCFVTDSISFSANITKQGKLETPLVRQLSLFNGCPFSPQWRSFGNTTGL